jgi:FlaA1/EpsC-like NDP-sugar epimerase
MLTTIANRRTHVTKQKSALLLSPQGAKFVAMAVHAPDSLRHTLVRSLSKTLSEHRIIAAALANILITTLSYCLALGLRFEFDANELSNFSRYVLPLTLLLLFRCAAYQWWNLNNRFWRYASVSDALSIAKAHGASSVVWAASVLLLRIEGFPRSLLFIELALSLLFAGGARMGVRIIRERIGAANTSKANQEKRQLIVLGAGDSGHLVVKTLLSQPRMHYEPVAILDDNLRLREFSVFGVPVRGGLLQLGETLEQFPHISAVILAIPSLAMHRVAEFRAICARYDVAFKRLQSFEDIACIDHGDSAAEGLSIEAALECEVRVEHEAEIRQVLRGSSILISGAGGSIGSEIVRQLLPFEPRKIVLLDNCEFHLFKISQEIAPLTGSIPWRPVLGDVTDIRRMRDLFAQEQPEFIFHAAAYKHVPLLEANAYEAFVNNVLGTLNLLKVSAQNRAKRFVLISTDKAVDPSSIMGCSKRLAELVLQEMQSSNSATALQTAVVRFGNVINSNGSVIPLFREQILRGGPLTVTHPDMLRYFMSIKEAVRLVLTAGTLGRNGDLFILDMGTPLKIVEVAKKMRALYGRRDIPIVYTGMRPGEKLTEELTSGSELLGPTPFNKVRRVEGDSLRAPKGVISWAKDLEQRLEQLSDDEIGQIMHDMVVRMNEKISHRGELPIAAVG